MVPLRLELRPEGFEPTHLCILGLRAQHANHCATPPLPWGSCALGLPALLEGVREAPADPGISTYSTIIKGHCFKGVGASSSRGVSLVVYLCPYLLAAGPYQV